MGHRELGATLVVLVDLVGGLKWDSRIYGERGGVVTIIGETILSEGYSTNKH